MIKIYNVNKKSTLKKCFLFLIAVLFIFIVGFILLKYEVEGENIESLPFQLTTIKIASKVEAKKIEDTENIWNCDISQINDVYINIKGNGREKIKNIKIENIKIKVPEIGEGKIVKLLSSDKAEENITSINYVGNNATDAENLTIAKDGGVVGFTYKIENIGQYISNEEEITYNMQLLEKMNISKEQLQAQINFDLIIEAENGINYIARLQINVPTKEHKIEEIDISKIIFKRLLQN